MSRYALLLLLAAASAGCATARQPAVSAASLPPCTVAAPGDGWRQVSADGLILCVPPSWSSAGSAAWRGDGGRIRWRWGVRARRVRAMAVEIRTDRPTAPQIEAQMDMRSVHRSTETIGGAQVDLWISEIDGSIRTGARWRSGDSLTMMGEAPSLHTAELQLDVYRTARVELP